MATGYNQPEIYTQYENASGKRKILLGREIAKLQQTALKKEKLERQNLSLKEKLERRAENIALKRGFDETYNLKNMNSETGFAPMGGMPNSEPPLTAGFGGTINFGGDTGNKNMLYVAGGVVAFIIAIGVSFNVGRKRNKRRR